jgi:inosine-uridine nucleoside N-ribohydrolase
MCCATDSRPVIVDTDLSTDDYVALLYLLRHPAIDVRAITVANGIVHVKWGVENARRLLALVGRTDIPVAGGPEKPLAGQHAFPASWRIFLDVVPRLMFPRARPAPEGLTATVRLPLSS